jgi:predicted membrane protein
MLTAGSAGGSNNDDDSHLTLRDRLRQITGFSLTAFRATVRGITGISLTALYASAVATTSSFVRNTMKVILSVFPSWVRSLIVCVP